jgi:thiamine-phosphate pyrophosphorylase
MSEGARLVLMTPVAGSDPAMAQRLVDALSGGAVAAVILRLPPMDERGLVKLIKPFGPIVQDREAALLVADHPDVVARSGADGVHVSDPRALAGALQLLRPQQRIVGAGGLRARHDAMEAAEAGCDYVMFGEPDKDGATPPFPGVLERTQWWAEVFQTPCVAYCAELSQVSALAETGCEFIALGEAVFSHANGPARAVEAALSAIEAVRVHDR